VGDWKVKHHFEGKEKQDREEEEEELERVPPTVVQELEEWKVECAFEGEE